MAGLRRILVLDRSTGEVTELGPGAALTDPAAGEDDAAAIVLDARVAPPFAGGVPDASHVGLEVVLDGWRFEFDVIDAERADLRERARGDGSAQARHGPTEVRAIIPGRVLSIAVADGDHVTMGQRLLSVEAMKMENELRAPRDGVVTRVAVAPGVTVELGDLLVVLG
jgi:biotin carboxyl carrier protein